MSKKPVEMPEAEPEDVGEYEPDYEEQNAEEPDVEEPDTSSYFHVPFTVEQMQNAHLLRNTPYKDEVIQLLESTTLSPSCKRSIKTFIEQYLSERTILANFISLDYATVSFDLSEVKMKTNYWPTDLKKPILFHILNLVRDHFMVILTNAYGPDRERILNGRQTVENRNVNMSEPIKVKDREKRTGIFGGAV